VAPAVRTYSEGTPFTGVIGRTKDDSVPAWPVGPTPPAGAPNVVYVVLDDVGFAQLACFGGSTRTPVIDAIAQRGVRYRNFHTTAMCSPTRAALLTGRNSHTVGMGGITDQATGYPGYNARLTKDSAFISEVLVNAGWSTWAVGKWHLAPNEEMDAAASRKRWPLGRGFERYYGFIGAETNHWEPDLVIDNHHAETPRRDGYHLTEDLVDRAIDLLHDHRNVTPTKPFFAYLAFGAAHAPHHVPTDWIERERGRWDQGWDVERAATHERQLAAGILPAGTDLSARPAWIPAWDTLDAAAQRVYARQMEVFAAFLTHTDFHLGRFIDALQESGDLDNTILVLLSDNGASAEGGLSGSFNENLFFNLELDTVENQAERAADLGGLNSYPHYSFGWAHAGNTPFQRWKRETHEGGIADPLIVSWPAGVAARGEIRGQYTHAIDVTPTVLDLVGLVLPAEIDGHRQKPFDGTTFAPALDDASAAEHRVTQFYEQFACRAIYHHGWKALCFHSLGATANYGAGDPNTPLDDDPWELYHVAVDASESHDLADAEPRRLAQLKDLWWAEAGRYQALPLQTGRQIKTLRPSAHTNTRERYLFRRGPAPIPMQHAPDVMHRRHVIEADITVPAGGADGVLVAHGGRFGGYAIYVINGHLNWVHNRLGLERFTLRSPDALPVGRHLVGVDFTPSVATAGDALLLVDGAEVASLHVQRTVLYTYSLVGDDFCIGHDSASAVGPYDAPFPYAGEIHHVAVDVSGISHHDLERELERSWRTQ
jgi:arylsulfatase A-like enzyme